ncbi:DNA cytosine methyltransferase [Alkaliphilus oremlandii]|uniref:Cytosine-specific methyltransferase n=1 Tax=Alkaliphilus oremlandii (strain OhILAs) TaxID=350688 RepID=A8MI05_ALKOO|nr:DNA cytosine methyltransferase [Alkaliphilus oremlandii]ABW19437.1 DNA-cytosine methyltransferase [Alkaliphilus oremlandii OhILAs]
MRTINFLDLFAGAGGLSEGFLRAGFEPVAHIELDANACKTLKTRSIYHYLKKNDMLDLYRTYQKTYNKSEDVKDKAIEKLLSYIPKDQLEPVMNIEISEKTLPYIFQEIDCRLKHMEHEGIDLIIGGPPCQAYSLVGRARDENNMEDDPRNYLYKLYIRFLNKYKPKAFIFENVPGILTAFKGNLFRNLQAYMRRVGYNIQARKMDAKDFGVLQSRKRVIIIGWRKDLEFDYPIFESDDKEFTVNNLLEDLPKINSGEIYDKFRYRKKINKYLQNTQLRVEDDIITHHIARPNNERDLEIYRIAVETWNRERARIKYTDLPERLMTHNNLTSFLDRFKVVAGDEKYSHTVVAHISKDGHHYIHPDIEQNRSITVREAARIQSFPDDYYFEGPRTSNFVQIGNAVPPLMAEKLAYWFKEKFEII